MSLRPPGAQGGKLLEHGLRELGELADLPEAASALAVLQGLRTDLCPIPKPGVCLSLVRLHIPGR